MNQFYNKHFLKLLDFSKKDLYKLITISEKLKYNKKNFKEKKLLIGKNVILIFEKNSTRTRCSFEIACFDQGVNITFLNTKDSHIGYKESLKDSAKILSRMYDGLEYRGYYQKNIEILAKYSTIPVWNGLTNEFHPIQILTDLLTIKENIKNKNIDQIKLSYIGDINNNISYSLIEASIIIGFTLYLISPQKLEFKNNFYIKNIINKIKYYNNIHITNNINIGVKNADFIYTDVWLSMDEKNSFILWENKIKLLYNYQVNKSLLEKSENNNVKIMHCLPSLHSYNHYKKLFNKNILSKYNLYNGLEITNDVFESDKSIIFQQAENKIHIIKAIMITSLLKENINIFN
ncbi:ornithine carbamoyltransferase [Enterobacteriaceae endosymbiont of Donacia cincticornis]|uniref:ornithine carbamoyltransferase n=1 Tax=Enterobacteriaceae endosymbiont of Donacia cincticornis TaxID=2675773 RepID=UPI001448A606|nr:ornithine carbamoyltransferase [Enterobacteriaceae endosymbiont of Donacia cincticornis]QJC36045.1 ornithine carbamoyltransferase [Enterobacteriaceae endosymbiont of Donacia cincticornis]